MISCITVSTLRGQNSNAVIDSLQNLLSDLNKQKQSFINDTSKIRNLNLLASKYISAGELEKGDSLAYQALAIAKNGLLRAEGGESIAYKKGMAKSYRNRGNATFYMENYNGALDFYQDEIAIYESFLSDGGSETFVKSSTSELARVLRNIGNVYSRQDNYPKALDSYYRSLKLSESLNDEKQSGTTCGNMGVVYDRMRDYPKALEFYQKALRISQKEDNKPEIARSMANIGIVYSEQENNVKAVEYLTAAYKLSEKETDLNAETSYLSQLGSVYGVMGENEKAFEALNKALKLAEELDDKGLVSNLNGNIGGILLKQNKLKEAEGFLLKAFSIAKEIGELYDQKEWAFNLSELYQKQNKTDLAFSYYQQYDQVKDSIFNKENSMSTLRHEMDYEYGKREMKEKAEHEKQIIMFQAEKKMSRQMLFFLAIGIILVLLLLFFVQRAYNAKKKYANVLAAEGERKELLLQEVHHRIGNNLQIISSLLSLQVNAVQDEKLSALLLQSQNRIQSLSTLHELLYQSDTQLQINIKEYIGKVLDFHRDAASGLLNGVKVSATVSAVNFPAKIAVPVALIINELVTNSLKYAFPEGSSGEVSVRLFPSDNKPDEWILIVSDNGKGFVTEVDPARNSLGLKLVRIMVKQLKGSLEMESKEGASVKVTFSLPSA